MQIRNGIERRRLRALLCAVLFLAVLLLAGCGMTRDQPAMYFDGAARMAAQAIDEGDLARLKSSVQGQEIDARGRKNMTLLWYAIKGKHYDAVRELIAMGAKPDANGVTPLGTPLYHALTHDTRLLQAMLDGGLSPNYQDDEGTTLLQRAMIGDAAAERVKLLVERKANVNARDSIDGSALYESLTTGQPEIAIYLVEHGARFDISTVNGVSPAWSIYRALGDLQPGTSSGHVTDISMENGVPVTRDTTPPPLADDENLRKRRADLEQLRDLMIARGAKWPPDDPATVREKRKAQGLEVAE